MRIVLNPQSYMIPLLSAALAANQICPRHLELKEKECKHCHSCIECWNEALENADGWIPASEQQPYIDGKPMSNVIVTMLDSQGERFVTNALDRAVTRENKIIAWQPYPEIYKEET